MHWNDCPPPLSFWVPQNNQLAYLDRALISAPFQNPPDPLRLCRQPLAADHDFKRRAPILALAWTGAAAYIAHGRNHSFRLAPAGGSDRAGASLYHTEKQAYRGYRACRVRPKSANPRRITPRRRRSPRWLAATWYPGDLPATRSGRFRCPGPSASRSGIGCDSRS